VGLPAFRRVSTEFCHPIVTRAIGRLSRPDLAPAALSTPSLSMGPDHRARRYVVRGVKTGRVFGPLAVLVASVMLAMPAHAGNLQCLLVLDRRAVLSEPSLDGGQQPGGQPGVRGRHAMCEPWRCLERLARDEHVLQRGNVRGAVGSTLPEGRGFRTYAVGDAVLATGYGLGERHWGGLAQQARMSAAQRLLDGEVRGRLVVDTGRSPMCSIAKRSAVTTAAAGGARRSGSAIHWPWSRSPRRTIESTPAGANACS
jgi:hypothetical protein